MANSSQQLNLSAFYTDQEYREIKALTESTATDKLDQLDAYLEKNPGVMLKKDMEEGRTIVHWAAIQKTPDLLNLVHKHLVKRKLEQCLLQKDNHGNTPLHYCAQYGTVEVAETLLAKLKREEQQQAATTLNDVGNNPIDITLLNRKGEELPPMYQTLRDAGAENQTGVLPLGMMLDEKEILSRYPECKQNPELYENLVLACKIANIARKIVKISSSHPDCNSLAEQARVFVKEQLMELYKYTEDEVTKLCEGHKSSSNSLELKMNYLIYQAVKSRQAANCEQFAFACMTLLFIKIHLNNKIQSLLIKENRDNLL